MHSAPVVRCALCNYPLIRNEGQPTNRGPVHRLCYINRIKQIRYYQKKYKKNRSER